MINKIAEKIDHLGKLYNEKVRDLVWEFYGIIRSNPNAIELTQGDLVGLLTFPNSGTSWFLRLTHSATGICNHTAYEHESIKTNGKPSRGAYTLKTPNTRLPRVGEPSLVKSHVTDYGDQDIISFKHRKYRVLVKNWMNFLPANCARHIRLVRNPLDNLRARYHLNISKNSSRSEMPLMSFRSFYRQDLHRYLIWHAYCDRVADFFPILSLRYSDLLDKNAAPKLFLQAMQFAGYKLQFDSVERAFAQFPPKYAEKYNLPVHLRYYDEEDIHWIADELKKWMSTYSKLGAGRMGMLSNLKNISWKKRSLMF